jgi:hypothetical protein
MNLYKCHKTKIVSAGDLSRKKVVVSGNTKYNQVLGRPCRVSLPPWLLPVDARNATDPFLVQ